MKRRSGRLEMPNSGIATSALGTARRVAPRGPPTVPDRRVSRILLSDQVPGQHKHPTPMKTSPSSAHPLSAASLAPVLFHDSEICYRYRVDHCEAVVLRRAPGEYGIHCLDGIRLPSKSNATSSPSRRRIRIRDGWTRGGPHERAWADRVRHLPAAPVMRDRLDSGAAVISSAERPSRRPGRRCRPDSGRAPPATCTGEPSAGA